MHEMALSESVVRILEEQAGRHGFARVRRVRVEIGALSHAEPQAIAFCFEAAARGTVAEGATMDIVRVSGQARCLTCSAEITISQRYDPCPACGGHDLDVTAGEELRVSDAEVE